MLGGWRRGLGLISIGDSWLLGLDIHQGLMVNGGLGGILWRFWGTCGASVAKSQVTIFPVRAGVSACQIREKLKILGIVAGKWG